MNRYWFSQKQKEQHEKHEKYGKYSSSRKAEVLTDEGWKEYTQWCSSGDDCPWEDAVLVAESKNKLQLRIDGHVQG
jgi:hypothetical protein